MNPMAERFVQLLDRYGGRLADWPAGEQEAARAFVQRHPEVAEELRRAEELEVALDGIVPPPSTPSLQRRLASIPALEADETASWLEWLRTRFWQTATGMAVAGALGVLVGLSSVGASLDDVIAPEVALENQFAGVVLAMLEEDGQ